MHAKARPRSPALLPAVALLLGVVLFDLDAIATILAVSAALVVWAAASRSGRAAALLGCLAGGVFLAAHAQSAAEARVAWLPRDGAPVERALVGKILTSPEVDATGARTIVVAGAPESDPGIDRPATVRLLVQRSSNPATEPLDQLRRGDTVRIWARIRLPRALGNPDQTDPLSTLRARGIDAVGSVKNARLVERLRRGGPSLLRILDEARVQARRQLDRSVPREGPHRAVLGAMTLGERGRIESREILLLRDSGLLHILAISGLNVSLLLSTVLWWLCRTRLKPLSLFLLAASGLAAFAWIVGAEPSVVRAALGAGVLLLGRTIGRDGDPLNSLAVVGASMIAYRPAVVWDPGFQLSFLATAGILVLAVPIARSLPVPRTIGLALGVSAAAYLTTAPATAWHFGRIAPVSLLSNLIAGPLCAAGLALGCLTVVAGPVPWLGAWIGSLAGASVETLLAVASTACSVPGGALRVPRPSPVSLVLYFLLLLAATADASGATRRVLRLVFALVLLLLHTGLPPSATRAEAELSVIDVGQGQAVAVRAAPSTCVVVDAGGTAGGRFDLGERVVVPFLSRWGCRRVEALILTHDHDDHAGGAAAVLRELEVGELWIGAGSMHDRTTRDLAADAIGRGVAVVLAERGLEARRSGIAIEVLHPDREDAGLPINDRCVVIHAGLGSTSALIPGDLELEGERRLLASGRAVRASALVVGHHGAARSTSTSFLDAVQPKIAVISVGRGNRFGHPDPGVVERLRRAGVAVYRTDRDGMVGLRAGTLGRWEIDAGSERTWDERHGEEDEE